ncbi:glycosyl transferase [Shinella sp.]|uniref:glycosyl transferase n=1 Tax=Shinella sp. TaxID=1870904 RepID=UPI0028ABD6EF|nr:glycosyl transferase [Shinella sp.]
MKLWSERPPWRSVVKVAAALLGKSRRHAHAWLPYLALQAPDAEGHRAIVYHGKLVGSLLPATALRERAGPSIFIVGSGPSINDNDLVTMEKRSGILLNGAIGLIGQAITEPLAIAIEDERFIWRHFALVRAHASPETILLLSTEVIRAICEIEPAFLDGRKIILIDNIRKPYRKMLQSPDSLSALPFVVLDGERETGLSLDPDKGVFQGGSVAISALQFAMFCEPREIGLLGIDIVNADQPRFYERAGQVAGSGIVRARSRIMAHFRLAKEICARRGITIHNHSAVSALAAEGFGYDDRFAREKDRP